MKITRTRADLIMALGRNLKFLKELLTVYIEKDVDSAILIAVVLRTLLYDGPKGSLSRSLLGQLNIKAVEYLDTAKDKPEDNPYDSFRALTLFKNNRHFPLLDLARTKSKSDFQTYWNKIVIEDDNKNQFTRGDIVKYVADQDGGAHEDPSLDKGYFELTRRGSGGWTNSNGDPLLGEVLAALAQIAYEIEMTFNPIYSKLKGELT